MKCKIMVLFGLFILALSCKKITNVNLVDGVNSGKLSYKLVDDAGKGLAGTKVSLYDAKVVLNTSYPSANALIATIRTDQDGVAYFSDLLPKNYLVICDTAIVNKARYRTDEFVQVVADTDKKKSVKVSAFSGTLNLTLISTSDYRSPLKNVGVVAYPVNDIKLNSGNVSDVINSSSLKGVTDASGLVSLKLPSNIPFDFIVYNLTNRNLGYGYGNYSVAKDTKSNMTLYSYPF
ncbi:SpaA isopeptide-forming pilin-related protein [Pedobacter ginsenosidimutans]|nr:SpaA isopeptide-forming pilin-related protein [Pedobacter ginsenosidimutans]